ncbi:MAG: CRISPR-associated protein Cas4 [Herpetosiphon sp.]
MGWLLLILAVVCILAAHALRQQTGLPWKRVVYNDVGWQHQQRPLFAPEHGLVGRPDYLVSVHKKLVPVEVKPGRMARSPYPGDLMQLAAYCLLVESTTGSAPRYGLLRYAEQTFQLAYTSRVRAELLTTLGAIREAREAAVVHRSHQQAGRCRSCGFRATCEETLA